MRRYISQTRPSCLTHRAGMHTSHLSRGSGGGEGGNQTRAVHTRRQPEPGISELFLSCDAHQQSGTTILISGWFPSQEIHYRLSPTEHTQLHPWDARAQKTQSGTAESGLVKDETPPASAGGLGTDAQEQGRDVRTKQRWLSLRTTFKAESFQGRDPYLSSS